MCFGTSLLGCFACSTAQCCIGTTCSCTGKAFSWRKSFSTRACYVGAFFFVSLLAFVIGEWSDDALALLPAHYRSYCPPEYCEGPLAVFRVMSGLIVFHIVMALLLIGVRSSHDVRSVAQDGLWWLKAAGLLAALVATFAVPAKAYAGIVWALLVAAVAFVVVQLVLLVDFAHSWNEAWIRRYEDGESKLWAIALIACTAVMYLLSMTLDGVMWGFYCTGGHCWINALFVTFTLLACLAVSVLSVLPRVQQFNPRSGILQSSVVTLYATYLVWSAIMSEPQEMRCNRLFDTQHTGSAWASLVLGALLTIVAVCYSTVRTASATSASADDSDDRSSAATSRVAGGGDIEQHSLLDAEAKHDSDSDSEHKRNPRRTENEADNDDEADGTVYNYSLFHVAFALGAAYVAMLLTNWRLVHLDDSAHAKGGVAVDYGMASVYAKAGASVVVVLLYGWSVIAPGVLRNRDFS